MKVGVVIRTLDEERHLGEVLDAIENQEAEHLETEVVVVDSGSTDRTLDIAVRHGCRIELIDESEFSFGRSLNRGCEATAGEILVFLSGHCVPVGNRWLDSLVSPLLAGEVAYVYGRQVGGKDTKFSERQLFRRQYPELARIPQEGFFCNNANAALCRNVWEKFHFDEELSGLEDMGLAKTLVREGLSVGYAAEACVVHHHHETWRQVRWRFEREAVALQHLLPEVHIGRIDFLRYLASAVLLDAGAAVQERALLRSLAGIVRFRFAQYWGSYCGNHEHRHLSRRQKELYFYPKRC